LNACKICGKSRTFAFAPFEFEGTDVDEFTFCDDPMSAFTDWVIHFEQRQLEKCGDGCEDLENEMEGEDEPDIEFLIGGGDEDDNWIQNALAAKDGENPTKKERKNRIQTLVYAHAGKFNTKSEIL